MKKCLSGALALSLLIAGTSADARRKKQDDQPPPTGTLIANVQGITPDGEGGIDRFRAMLIDGEGKIVATYQRAEDAPERVAYRLDGRNRVLVPGMIDGHAHVLSTGLAALTLDLTPARTLDETLSRIAAWAAAHPDAPWLIGRGWNQETWGLGRMPTAEELDRVTGGKPAVFGRVDGHAVWANSAAMKAAGVSAATKAPAGGEILRKAGSQAPSGVFVDNAMDLVWSAVPAPRPEDVDTALAKAQEIFLANGVTAAADMGTTIENWQAMRRSGDRGHLRMRIVSYAAGVDNMALIGGPGPSPWLYGDRLRIGGLKLLVDGALGSRGALLKAPYADAPGTKGLAILSESQLGNLMSRAALDKFQVAVHAIGDGGNRIVLDTIAELAPTYTGDRRWRIEHAQIVDPADFPLFGQHGVIASMQPQHEASDRLMAEARLGPNRLAGAYAWNSLARTGAVLAFGSDTPVEPPEPFLGWGVAVTRQGADGQPVGGWQPQERISREAAFAAYTTGAAYAMFAEDKLGRLAPGYRADFLFIDRDPFLVSVDQIKDTKVQETWVGGQKVWSGRDGSAPVMTGPEEPVRGAAPGGR